MRKVRESRRRIRSERRVFHQNGHILLFFPAFSPICNLGVYPSLSLSLSCWPPEGSRSRSPSRPAGRPPAWPQRSAVSFIKSGTLTLSLGEQLYHCIAFMSRFGGRWGARPTASTSMRTATATATTTATAAATQYPLWWKPLLPLHLLGADSDRPEIKCPHTRARPERRVRSRQSVKATPCPPPPTLSPRGGSEETREAAQRSLRDWLALFARLPPFSARRVTRPWAGRRRCRPRRRRRRRRLKAQRFFTPSLVLFISALGGEAAEVEDDEDEDEDEDESVFARTGAGGGEGRKGRRFLPPSPASGGGRRVALGRKVFPLLRIPRARKDLSLFPLLRARTPRARTAAPRSTAKELI